MLAVVCLALTTVGMSDAFEAADTGASAADLATGISLSLVASYAAAPLGLVGIVLLLVGFLVQRPAADRR